ncbi:hypothetical protein MTO96_028188 [Rhipicephalus appendiculatus]
MLCFYPPPSADDILTDEEEGDSDIAVVDTLPNDVAGEIEVHTADSDECEAALQEQAPPRPKKASKDPRAWRRTTQFSGAILETEFQPLRVTHSELVDVEPFDLFARLLNKEIIGLITDESNRYAQQQNDHNVSTTEHDILQFVAILFLSGYHKLPRSDLYWSKAEDLSVPLVANTMSRAKFRLIKRYIHACDSQNLEKGDKMAKIRPLLRLVNSSLQQFGIFSKNLSVDEQMVPYFGRHSCKMFIRGKPIRFGYKEWVLCSSSGYPFNIDIYCGKNDGESTNVPLGTRVVLNALKSWRLYTEVGSQPQLDQLQFTRLIVQGLLTKRLDTRERPGPSGALVFHSKEGHGHHLVPLGKQSRCRQCTKNTRMKCQMCAVPLHIHCSPLYHAKK